MLPTYLPAAGAGKYAEDCARRAKHHGRPPPSARGAEAEQQEAQDPRPEQGFEQPQCGWACGEQAGGGEEAGWVSVSHMKRKPARLALVHVVCRAIEAKLRRINRTKQLARQKREEARVARRLGE